MTSVYIKHRWKIVTLFLILLIVSLIVFLQFYGTKKNNSGLQNNLPFIRKDKLAQRISFNVTREEAEKIAKNYLTNILKYRNFILHSIKMDKNIVTGEYFYQIEFINKTSSKNSTTLIVVTIDAYHGYVIALGTDILFNYKCTLVNESLIPSSPSGLEINLSRIGLSENELLSMMKKILLETNLTFLVNNSNLTFRLKTITVPFSFANSIEVVFNIYYKGYEIEGATIGFGFNPCLNTTKYYEFSIGALPVWVFEDLDRYVKLEYKISSEDAVGIAINYLKEMIKNSSQYYGTKLVKYNYTVKKPKILRYIDINRDGIVDYMAPIYVVEIHYLTDKREGTITITIDAYSGLIV